MGRLGIANVSIALAWCIAYLVHPWRFFLPQGALSLAIAQYLGATKYNVLLVFVNYWAPAFVVYVALRLARIERYLAPGALLQAAIALGNALLVFVAFSASSSHARPVRLTGWVLVCGGLAWLLAASIAGRGEERPRVPVRLSESLLALLLVAVPGLFVLNALYVKGGALRVAAATLARFESLCASAGERIAKPVQDVESVYVDPVDTMTEYYRIERGVYSGTGWRGGVAQRAVSRNELQFYEMKNPGAAQGEPPYIRYTARTIARGEPAQELQSRYALIQRELLGLEDAKVGLKGAEIGVVDLHNNEKIATTTYYVSTWHTRFCGKVEEDHSFAPASFVKRALNLRPLALDLPRPPR